MNQFTKGSVVKTNIIFFMGMGLMLSGCTSIYSEVPAAKNFETTEQHVLQAAKHWDLINKKVSEDLISSIRSKVSKDERILIRPENSVFSHQLYMDAVGALTAAGYKVVRYDFMNSKGVYEFKKTANLPHHDVSIDLKTNLVRFSRDRKETQLYGGLTALASGLWFLKIWDTTNWGKGTGLLVGADALGYAYNDKYFADDTPQTEIIIDLIVSRSDEYLSVSKDIFYVISSDKSLYQAVASKEPLMRDYAIVGGKK